MNNRKDKQLMSWFQYNWKTKPLFSTGVALIVMIIFQTVALGFDYGSVGAWLTAWLSNWINILRNNSTVGIVALGMTFVIISGGIDLSVGSILVAVSAVLMVVIDAGPAGWLTTLGVTGLPAFVIGILVAVIFGTLIGALTGKFITTGKIPPFIATLGMMKILRSVTQHFMQTRSTMVPPAFLKIASVKIGNQMIMPIVYWLLIALLLSFVSKKTLFGRQVYAVGSNEKTSKLSGINVNRVKVGVYSLMGLLVSVAAILQVARIGSMDYANAGNGYEMDAIAAVIVGGTSMSGGKGSIAGSVLGMLIIAVMNNLLNLAGVPPFLREAFKGAIVIFAVLLQKKEGN